MQGWFENFSFGQSVDGNPSKASPAVSITSPKQDVRPETTGSSRSEDVDDFSDLPMNQYTAALRRTTTLMRTSLDSLEVKLNARIDTCINELEGRYTARLDGIEKLTAATTTDSTDDPSSPGRALAASTFGSSAAFSDDAKFNSLKDDVQTVVDAMRLELVNVKRKLGMLDETGAHFLTWASPRSDKGSTLQPWSSSQISARENPQGASGQDLVFKADVDCVVEELRSKFEKMEEDLQSIRDNQEHVYVKACYLALSAPDCSKEEKELMFQKLEEQENQWHKKKVGGRPNADDAPSDSGSRQSTQQSQRK